MKVLPYIEETLLYDRVAATSDEFERDLFDPFNTTADGAMHFSATEIGALICPGFSGESTVDWKRSDYVGLVAPTKPSAPALANYMAIVASHFTNLQGAGQLPDDGGTTLGDGGIVFPKQGDSKSKGLKLNEIRDGTSTTVLLCESRETAYAAWADGQSTWVVGAWPSNPTVPSTTLPSDGQLGWADNDIVNFASIAQSTPFATLPAGPYLPAARWSGTKDRQWGPSSEHTGGVVVHVFADAHVSTIAPDIDKTVYLRLISRAGGEAIPANGDW